MQRYYTKKNLLILRLDELNFALIRKKWDQDNRTRVKNGK